MLGFFRSHQLFNTALQSTYIDFVLNSDWTPILFDHIELVTRPFKRALFDKFKALMAFT